MPTTIRHPLIATRQPANTPPLPGRSDLLAIVAISGVVLTTLGALDVKARDAEAVVLEGVVGRGLSKSLGAGEPNAGARSTLTWAAESLLEGANGPATTVLIAWGGTTLLRQGTLPAPPGPTDDPGPPKTPLGTGKIALKAYADSAPVYLPALQNLPGRIEFTIGWLPRNTQSAVVVELGDGEGVMVLGSDRARAFTPVDLRAAFLIAQPVTRALKAAEEAARA